MYRKGDLERYARNHLDVSIDIQVQDAQEQLFGEGLEFQRNKSLKGSRWAMLGVDYDERGMKTIDVCFYAAERNTAQQTADEIHALAALEKAFVTDKPEFDRRENYLSASGKTQIFLERATECINNFLRS